MVLSVGQSFGPYRVVLHESSVPSCCLPPFGAAHKYSYAAYAARLASASRVAGSEARRASAMHLGPLHPCRKCRKPEEW